MLQFLPLKGKEEILTEYMETAEIEFCDISVGVKYMWRDEYVIDYAVYNGTLIMKETSPTYSNEFYYPIGKDVDGAITQIENYCREKGLPLVFCCIDNAHASKLVARYHFAEVASDRDWDDYIYDAEKFKTYSGKKFSGQRNHVNKFKKTYPDYKFKVLEPGDLPLVQTFLQEYERGIEGNPEKLEEAQKVNDYIYNSFRLNQAGGIILVEGKVVALSIGERVKNTLIVHVEKGLKSYAGVYPTMAMEFAKAFGQGVKYINREEDCGDMGLRVSKLQYQPMEIKEKNIVTVKTAFDKLDTPFNLKTERLTITDILPSDKGEYFNLCSDIEQNLAWGYDYRSEKDFFSAPEYYYNFYLALIKNKEERPLAIRKDGVLIGEVTLHNFDYYGGVEIGFRVIKTERGNGYAKEAVRTVIEYLKNTVCPKVVKAKRYKANTASKTVLEKLGFICVREDQNYFYYEL